jgi:endonuclease/exonuclease/phosphatase family metal-dependent hydrolase
MNSRGASRAPARRNLAAHDRQALGVVFGGDFNMRHSQERWDNFSTSRSSSSTAYAPIRWRNATCACLGTAMRRGWIRRIFNSSGRAIRSRSGRSASKRMAAKGPKLSDHDGFKVTYRLTWPIALSGRHDR